MDNEHDCLRELKWRIESLESENAHNLHCANHWKKEYDTLKAARPEAVPSGWKLVPMKPTPEMLLAAHPPFEQINAWCAEMQTARGRVPNWSPDDPPLQQAWRAMLEAAPTPQLDEGAK